MTGIVADTAVAIGASVELSILAKATLVVLGGLAAARSRRGRASVRHLVLACTFAALLALPVAALVMPAIGIDVAVSDAAHNGSRGTGSAPAMDATVHPTGSPVATAGSILSLRATPGVGDTLRLLWAVGVALLLASLAAALRRSERLRRAGLPCLELAGLTRRLAADAGIRRTVDVVVHEDVTAPMTCGLRHATIVLPPDIDSWGRPEVHRALVHELEHVRRGDWLLQIGARALCAAYWFHPLVWIAARRMCLEAERACDDAVLRTAERTDYAEQLVMLARRLSKADPSLTLAMASRSDLSARVSSLLDTSRRRGRAGVACVAAAATSAAIVVALLAPIRAVAASVDDLDAGTADDLFQSRRVGSVDRALYRAARNGDIERIAQLLDGGANANVALEGDGSPLIAAARAGKLAAVRLLLDRGADPNMAVSGDGNPLIMAAREGHADVVTLLLDRGADIDRIVPSDENALIQASGAGQLDVVKLLVSRGANVNTRVWVESTYTQPGGEWRTPLSLARKSRNSAVVSFLQSAGARE